MKVAIDIGGVISKYPTEFRKLIVAIACGPVKAEVHIITDQHPKDEVLEILRVNGVAHDTERVHCADHATHGDACKAVLLRGLGIDIFIDDYPGYLVWPWPTPAPMRLRVEPDPRRPYWHPSWQCEGGDFGRRVYLGE